MDLVCFSSTNCEHLIFVSTGKVHQWSINGDQTGPSYNASYIAFSLDYALCASYIKNTVIVQNFNSGAVTAKLYLSGKNWASCCCFSLDNRLVAAGSGELAYVWNIANLTPQLVATFVGHVDDITSLAFSSTSSLITASEDRSVKFWEVDVSSTGQVMVHHNSTQFTPTSIEFVSLELKEGVVISCDSEGVVKIWDISNGSYKTSFQTPARYSFHGDAQLMGDKLLAIWGLSDEICIWDGENGKLPQTLNSDTSHGLRISGDGSKVFNVNWINRQNIIQAWSTWKWELAGEVKLEDEERYEINSFNADGSKVWVQPGDLITKGWDFETSGFPPIPLSNSTPERPSFDFVDGEGVHLLSRTQQQEKKFLGSLGYMQNLVAHVGMVNT